MAQTPGLHRQAAAEFLARRLGAWVTPRRLRGWERAGLLTPEKPRPGRGPHAPVLYSLPDLIAAEIVALVRPEGAAAARLRRALKRLELEPERRGWRQLAVTALGELRWLDAPAELLELRERPAIIFDPGAVAREARAAMREDQSRRTA